MRHKSCGFLVDFHPKQEMTLPLFNNSYGIAYMGNVMYGRKWLAPWFCPISSFGRLSYFVFCPFRLFHDILTMTSSFSLLGREFTVIITVLLSEISPI
jgi:hypothetical protein